MASQSLKVWRVHPILDGTIKRAPGLSRSETLMPPRLKLSFGPSGIYMQISIAFITKCTNKLSIHYTITLSIQFRCCNVGNV